MSDIAGQHAQVRTAFEQPTLDLLHQTYAPVVLAVFRSAFPREDATIATGRLHEQVDTYLDELHLAGVSPLPVGSGRELCNRWRNQRWIDRDIDDESSEIYVLTSAARDALALVARMSRERGGLSEHRVNTILAAARRFNGAANPDRDARIRLLEGQIKDLTRELERLKAGGPMQTADDDFMLSGYSELLDLVADLPSDFARVSESLASLRTDILTQFRAETRPGGQVVHDYLTRSDHLMDGTAEGRAFKGASALLADDGLLTQLRGDLADLLDHPVARDILTSADQDRLRQTVPTIRAGLRTVLAQRQRVTKSVKDYVVTHDLTRDRELDTVLRQLDAELATWLTHTGPRNAVPLQLLPANSDVTTLRRRFYDPVEAAVPDKLTVPEDQRPDVPTLDQLRRHGGPSFDDLRAELLDALASHDPDISLATIFADLPRHLRRPVEILGLITLAADQPLGRTPGADLYPAIRDDGSTRTFLGPQIVPSDQQTEQQ